MRTLRICWIVQALMRRSILRSISKTGMKANKRVWLIYDLERYAKAGGYYELYFEHFDRLGFAVELIFVEKLSYESGFCYDGQRVELPLIAIVRTYNLEVTKELEKAGVQVFNNAYIAEYCNDKQKTYELVKAAGIPIPDTICLNKSDYIYKLKNYSFPAVLKSLFGHGGEEVYWIKDIEELKSKLQSIKEQTFILQQPVSESGKDVRIYVVGKDIIAAMLRYNPNDFRSNYCLGGSATRYHLNKEELGLVNNIISLFDFGMVGIDFMFDKGKTVLNEIEDVVGARMLYRYTDIDIVKLYADYIIKKSINN
ncbi:MAG: RimK family alpha-L-glutamate ligase [Clostridia bacterium]|nr:RimK family alpha-L-glutamate ligase [Clostridia bacterium]